MKTCHKDQLTEPELFKQLLDFHVLRFNFSGTYFQKVFSESHLPELHLIFI